MSRHDSRDISRVYSFGTTGDISFKLPVTLTITFNKFRVENPRAVDVYKLSRNKQGKDSMVPMNAVVDSEKGTCTLTITELGSFVVAEKE